MTIIKQVVNEAVKRVANELSVINKDIGDFNEPITMENLQEKINGRLSSENLQKNYDRKLKLENELYELTWFKCREKKLFQG